MDCVKSWLVSGGAGVFVAEEPNLDIYVLGSGRI